MTEDNEATQLREALRDEKLGNYLASKLRDGESRMDKLDHSVEELKSDVVKIREDLTSVLDVLGTAKAGLKFIGYFGFFVKWAGGTAVGFIALNALWDKFFK